MEVWFLMQQEEIHGHGKLKNARSGTLSSIVTNKVVGFDNGGLPQTLRQDANYLTIINNTENINIANGNSRTGN